MSDSAEKDAAEIRAKVEASSLGTPEAQALRATVSDEHAARIVARAKEISAEKDALRMLVSDWQANGNSRPLGDQTAATWHECARQLLRVIDGPEAPAPPPRRHAPCGSIQCVECYPGWGERYNEAARTSPLPPAVPTRPTDGDEAREVGGRGGA